MINNTTDENNSKIRTNVKSEKRIQDWLLSNNFCKKKYRKSDFVQFLTNCPLSISGKPLSVHNTRITQDALTLMLKDTNIKLCFNLVKVKEGFMLKTGSEPAWIFNSRGKLTKRLEHKKVKIWLKEHGIDLTNDLKTDLQITISSCPICKSEKPLRFHRSSDVKLNLQCGCVNYLCLFDFDDHFILTHKSKIIKTFDSKGAEIIKN